jgi:ankyrin repeat protein
MIAETCLTYLSFNVFAHGYCESEEELKSLLNDNPLLDYAARNWGRHARRHQESIKTLAIGFLRNDQKVACASQVMFVSSPAYIHYFPSDFSGVHILAYYGLEHILRCQLENGADADKADSDAHTPLSSAAENGHEAVVKLLLTRDDVKANSRDWMGQTPLSFAAENGHETIVKLLARDDLS